MFIHRRGRRTLIALTLAALTVASTAVVATADPQSTQARCSAGYLAAGLNIPRLKVDSAVLDTTGSYVPPGSTTAITGLPGFCAVNLTQTDPAGNPIHIAVWLPTNWNGRFQGVGGGGFSCGIGYSTGSHVSPGLAETIKNGYAAAGTDCGVPLGDAVSGRWALDSNGRLNQPLIEDFASAAIHGMTVVGKAVTQRFYPDQIRYSYFTGCSTGGREALMEAQRYPADYNGIVSGAPAINWTSWVPAALWPPLVMKQLNDALPSCKEDAFTQAVVKACDGDDGITDGIIGDPASCDWNADELVGESTPCGTITATDAAVMNKIWKGPELTGGLPLWYGLTRGASPSMIAGTTTANGVTTPEPFGLPVAWLGTWLQRNPDWDWRTLTYDRFSQLFAQSRLQFSSTLDTNDPDLSAFNSNGGKILMWHGLADQLIPPQGTVDYYRDVQRTVGGTSSFARLFPAPGAAHCANAAGPVPDDPVAAVAAWVEHGQAPQSIPATLTDPATGAVTLSRQLCAYPLVARPTGCAN
ncbi:MULTISPECIES: tannase/feruloyl esterase family alpha/beta hydrolase [Amycolatopsis]|uniref:Feruloyl esterase n=2 Tax=Amycolatopsis TaxID=1813 RepID=A0A1I4C7U3_9PSEU|nr:tannase/feruloyl esterase family alpha/beta hydrolase [Amycolatopsis sacchari]SFK76427.1 feruloyl esterase [Amycolatopsis sacchari]